MSKKHQENMNVTGGDEWSCVYLWSVQLSVDFIIQELGLAVLLQRLLKGLALFHIQRNIYEVSHSH